MRQLQSQNIQTKTMKSHPHKKLNIKGLRCRSSSKSVASDNRSLRLTFNFNEF